MTNAKQSQPYSQYSRELGMTDVPAFMSIALQISCPHQHRQDYEAAYGATKEILGLLLHLVQGSSFTDMALKGRLVVSFVSYTSQASHPGLCRIVSSARSPFV